MPQTNENRVFGRNSILLALLDETLRHTVKGTMKNMVCYLLICKRGQYCKWWIIYLWRKERRICRRPVQHRSLCPVLRCSQYWDRNPPTPFVFCRRPYQLYEHRFDGLMALLTPFRCRISVWLNKIPSWNKNNKYKFFRNQDGILVNITLRPLIILLTAPLVRTSSISWLIRRRRKRRTGPWDRSSRKKNCTSKLTANSVSSLVHEPTASVLLDRSTSASSSANNSCEVLLLCRTCYQLSDVKLAYRKNHHHLFFRLSGRCYANNITKIGFVQHTHSNHQNMFCFYATRKPFFIICFSL